MEAAPSSSTRRGFLHRNRVILSLLLVAVLTASAMTFNELRKQHNAAAYQREVASFYKAPKGWAQRTQGTLLRSRRLYLDWFQGRAWRVLYTSRDYSGYPTVSSGLVFAPSEDGRGRPVVAFAHGTVGLGTNCAPSRQENPYQGSTWVQDMVQRGWVVTATDYAGLGTGGTSSYLVGQDEAHDVWNSVVAAHSLPAGAGPRVAILGHSQGGHAALWSTILAKRYAPQYELVGTTALAPAAELGSLVGQQWNGPVAWAIGPDVVDSWPAVYPLNLGNALTMQGRRNWHRLARSCISRVAVEAKFRSLVGQHFFSENPNGFPSWYDALKDQTPTGLPAAVPVLVAQGLRDDVVIPNTTELLVKNQCATGANLEARWYPNANHLSVVKQSQQAFTNWIASRFRGETARSNCGAPMPAVHQPEQP